MQEKADLERVCCPFANPLAVEEEFIVELGASMLQQSRMFRFDFRSFDSDSDAGDVAAVTRAANRCEG